MKKLIFSITACLVIACNQNQVSQPVQIQTEMEQNNLNKAIVQEVYAKVIGQQDSVVAKKLIKEDYIQHNPMAKSGLSGFLELLDVLRQMPKPENQQKPFYRIIGEPPFVAIHLSINYGGQQMAVLDIFRLDSGKLAEHWDAVQSIPSASKNGNSMVKGPVEIEDTALTSANKRTIEDLYRNCLQTKNFTIVGQFVEHNLIQHHPELDNGSDAMIRFYDDVNDLSLHKTVVEGNFAVAQCSASINNKLFVIYDVFRLKGGKVMEQWSVRQSIPENIPHSNGMI